MVNQNSNFKSTLYAKLVFLLKINTQQRDEIIIQ
jgi:hypothetical protein